MQITFLENRTGEDITFRRYVLGGWQGTQVNQTHTLTLVPGYNALPEDAQEVPPYYTVSRPFGVPTVEQVPVTQYFRMSHIALEAGPDLLWAYSNYSAAVVDGRVMSQLIYVPGKNFEEDEQMSERTSMEMVGGHGKALAVYKITFDREKMTYALVTKEELGRITIELSSRT